MMLCHFLNIHEPLLEFLIEARLAGALARVHAKPVPGNHIEAGRHESCARAANGQTSGGTISGKGGMRLGIVFKPACRADVSRGCMPLPVECLYCSRAEGWYEVSFLSGEGASSASWSMASLCKNGLGWGLGCRHNTKVIHPCQLDGIGLTCMLRATRLL